MPYILEILGKLIFFTSDGLNFNLSKNDRSSFVMIFTSFRMPFFVLPYDIQESRYGGHSSQQVVENLEAQQGAG